MRAIYFSKYYLLLLLFLSKKYFYFVLPALLPEISVQQLSISLVLTSSLVSSAFLLRRGGEEGEREGEIPFPWRREEPRRYTVGRIVTRGQDEIKERRCGSRDNAIRRREGSRRIVHLSSVSIKRPGSSAATRARRRRRERRDERVLAILLPSFSALMLSYPLNPRILFSTAACYTRARMERKKRINHRCIAINVIASRTCRRPSRVCKSMDA